MALSVVEVLLAHGTIDQNALAHHFVHRYLQEPWRGYAGGARQLLERIAYGAEWREEAPRLFNGGSYGNGGAMRAAPIGAYFAADPERAALEAARSAQVTHAHLEGQAGAIAVAVAAAIVASEASLTGETFLQRVLAYVPAGTTQQRIAAAISIGADETERAATELGTGQQVAAFDTVPYCLWVVAHQSFDFETALWTTVSGLGDRDTTCAIVGGIIALKTAVPALWRKCREPLPVQFEF